MEQQILDWQQEQLDQQVLQDQQNLLQLLDKLLELLKEYELRTAQMISQDLQIIQDVLMSRNEIMHEMQMVKEKINIIAVGQENANLKAILNNTLKSQDGLSIFEKQVVIKMALIRQTQQSVLGKDFQITSRIKERYDTIRIELEELQKDKKKIDYFSSATVNLKGNSFDSHM